MPQPEANFHVPAGRRPEEFMNDAQLEEYYRREAEDAPTGKKKKAQLRHAKAKVAAALTAAVDPDAIEED